MFEFEINSPSNERIKRLVRLRERRHRDQEGVFLVEGPRLFHRAIESGLDPLEIYWDGSADADPGTPGAVLVEPSVLDKASYRSSSEGLIGVFGQFRVSLGEVDPVSPALVVVAEAIEKPGNLGAMMRTASAVGADALITLSSVDPFNPNVVRSSTGALFTLPLATADLPTLRSWTEEHGISLTATSPDSTVTLWDADLAKPCALMIGAEDSGLSDAALRIADRVISIPMTPAAVDSLNASVSLAVVAFEALRQRLSNAR